MKLVSLLFIFAMGFSYTNVDDAKIKHVEKLDMIVLTCDEYNKLNSIAIMSNPCSGMSNCGANTNNYCGHIDVNDPDGPNHTIICRGRPDVVDELEEN